MQDVELTEDREPGLHVLIDAGHSARHEDYYGASAQTVRVHLLEDTVVCFLDDLQLTPNEEFLIAAGRERAVIELRNEYQQAIGATYRAAVERATGRRVISFISATKLDPNYAVEIFRLAPATPPLPEPPTDDDPPRPTP